MSLGVINDQGIPIWCATFVESPKNLRCELRGHAAQSRSDFMMVAVGFSPRWLTDGILRRVATPEARRNPRESFNRRSATRLRAASDRGLKPTATVKASLREGRTVCFRVRGRGARGGPQYACPTILSINCGCFGA